MSKKTTSTCFDEAKSMARQTFPDFERFSMYYEFLLDMAAKEELPFSVLELRTLTAVYAAQRWFDEKHGEQAEVKPPKRKPRRRRPRQNGDE